MEGRKCSQLDQQHNYPSWLLLVVPNQHLRAHHGKPQVNLRWTYYYCLVLHFVLRLSPFNTRFKNNEFTMQNNCE